MTNASPMSHYRRTEIETASPAKLLLMLYDGAIRRLDRANRSIDSSDMSGAHDHLVRAQDIILELMLSLDWDVGGDIPARLHSLYDFMYRRLVEANIRKDKAPIGEVLSLLEQLRQTWSEVINTTPAAAAPVHDETPVEKRQLAALNVSG